MEEHRKSQSTRRDSSDRRGAHRRSEHRRKQNLHVDVEKRKTVAVSYTHLRAHET